MGKFRDSEIKEIKPDELILKDGIFHMMQLFSTGNTRNNRYIYKYVLTDKGIWTKGKGFLFFKGNVGFMPYSNIGSYRVSKFGNSVGYVFNPSNGKKGVTRIFFDDPEGALAVFDTFISKSAELDVEE